MSRYPVGRGLRVEVAKTMGAAKTVSAVTTASPGVATSTAHALTAGTVGVFQDVTGMLQLEGQAIRVAAPDSNTFELELYETTDMPAYTGGKLVPVTAWSTVGNATQYSIGQADAEQQDMTVLLDDIRQQEAGLMNAQTVSITGFSAFNSEAMQILQSASRRAAAVVFRITLKDGQQRIFNGTPSLPGEEASTGQPLTGAFSVLIKGSVMFLPAVAS